MTNESFASIRRYLPLVTLLMLALIWGYSWVPLKEGVHHSSPFVFAALRTVPGGFLMLGLMALLGRPLRPKGIGLTALIGLLQTTGFLSFANAALVSGGAGRISILTNTWQFWIPVMAWPVLKERLHGLQWLSVLLALAGLVLIVEPWNIHGVTSSLLALGAALCWAVGSIAVKILRRRHQVDLLSLTTWQMLFGALPLLLLSFIVDGAMPDWSGTFVWSLVFTLAITTCVASLLWQYALRELPAGIAGLGTMATPVIGVLASWAQLQEQPTLLEIIGMIVILGGMGILFSRGVSAPTRASYSTQAGVSPAKPAADAASAETLTPLQVSADSKGGGHGK
jgi:drug/metabolite transporter (DMT)-like permease